jgi:hypothetical protein
MGRTMRTLGDWVGLLGGIAGLIVLLTGSLVYVRGSYNKSLIEALRKDIGDYQAREHTHDREMAECQGIIARHEAEIGTLKSENVVLREAVTQRAAVDVLADTAERHHTEMMNALEMIRDALQVPRGHNDANN